MFFVKSVTAIGIVLSAYAVGDAGKLQPVLIGLSGSICTVKSTEIVALPQQVSDILRLVGDIILFEASAFQLGLVVLYFLGDSWSIIK